MNKTTSTTTEQERQLIEAYRAMTPEQKKALRLKLLKMTTDNIATKKGDSNG